MISVTAHTIQPFSASPGVTAGRGPSLALSYKCSTAHIPQHVGHVRTESMSIKRRRQKQNKHLATGTTTTCGGDGELDRAGSRHWPNRT